MSDYNTYIGARYVPIFKGTWDDTLAYEPLCIVQYQGNSYTSKTYVPAGTAITNETYWAITGNYNAQVEQYRQEVATYGGQISDISERMDTLEDDVTEDIGEITTRVDNAVGTLTTMVNDAVETFFNVKNYGAAADGSTDDYDAFITTINNAVTTGGRIVIPAGSYRLSKPVLVDETYVLTDEGTYPIYPVIISKDLKPSTFPSNVIAIKSFDEVIPTSYGSAWYLQSGCYNSNTGKLVLGFCSQTTGNNALLMEVDYTLGTVTHAAYIDAGHINDITYDSVNNVLYVCSYDSATYPSHMLVVNPTTFGIMRSYNVGFYPRQVACDNVNKVVYVTGSSDGISVYPLNDFTTRLTYFTFHGGNSLGIGITYNGQSCEVVEGQLLYLYQTHEELFSELITASNYTTGNVRQYWERACGEEEPECLIYNGSDLYIVSGQNMLTVKKIEYRNQSSYDTSILNDRGITIPNDSNAADYYKYPGVYRINAGANADTITGLPTGYAGGGCTIISHVIAYSHLEVILTANDAATIYIKKGTSLTIGNNRWRPIKVGLDVDDTFAIRGTYLGLGSNTGGGVNITIPCRLSETTTGKATLDGTTTVQLQVNGSQVFSTTLNDTTKISSYSYWYWGDNLILRLTLVTSIAAYQNVFAYVNGTATVIA